MDLYAADIEPYLDYNRFAYHVVSEEEYVLLFTNKGWQDTLPLRKCMQLYS